MITAKIKWLTPDTITLKIRRLTPAEPTAAEPHPPPRRTVDFTFRAASRNMYPAISVLPPPGGSGTPPPSLQPFKKKAVAPPPIQRRPSTSSLEQGMAHTHSLQPAEAENRALREHLAQMEAQVEKLNSALHENDSLATSQVMELRARLNEKEQLVKSLQDRLQWALDSVGKPFANFDKERADLVEQKDALERSLTHEQSLRLRFEHECAKIENYSQKMHQDRDADWREFEAQATEDEKKIKVLEGQRTQYEQKIKMLESQVKVLAADVDDLKPQLKDVHDELDRARSWIVNLNSFVGSPGLTPRMIILAKIAGEHFSSNATAGQAENNSSSPEEARFRQSYAAQDLTVKSLDVPLIDDALSRFIADLTNQSGTLDADLRPSHIRICAVCKAPKFGTHSDPANNQPHQQAVGAASKLNEFPWSGRGVRPLTRCSNAICSACFLSSITSSLKDNWFSNLGRAMWFRCPVDECDEFLDIPHLAELGNVLRRLGCQDVPAQIARYQRATVLRSALEAFGQRPTPRALEKAAALHARLISRGMMKSFFDPSFQSSLPDEEGRIPPFSAGPVRMFDIDHGEDTLSMPIFMKFLVRKTAATGRWCSGCCEVRCEIDFPSLDAWIETCQGFTGDWMWRILVFPEKMTASCGHEMDHCNSCQAEHMKAKLEELGRDVADNMPCPSEECQRKLSYDEVKLYAGKETAERYDKYLLLKSISQLPNFRWCSRGGCENGQLYEDEDEMISCDECGYGMCFQHQVPWHYGLTCEEYNSQKEHGDPSFQDTQEWIKENSKLCPGEGCGINIVKGDACFHMTCTTCGHEFCWECLSDWNLINPERGQYNAQAHKESCFFRTSELTPTQVMGVNLRDALGEGEWEDEPEEVVQNLDIDIHD
ncbi:hypothetical protein B0H66DRAFT_387035 [Apodospora peruviana]|uniref:RBR-type E3 ubiquitin transferase n=1 Tax=Apodospora peruviana TaxID=516989 RepID=A0AAE0HUH4_9PEZI|nr:hypothetical protein B0H66DRAFT_387035 [Apodospora peruviana]